MTSTPEQIALYMRTKRKYKRTAESYAAEHEYDTATGTYERDYENTSNE